MSDRYLVTGGAGFIGSHLVERLARDGAHVRVLDDLSTGLRGNLDGVPAARLEVVEGDLRDRRVVDDAVHGCRGVFHLGAIPSVAKSVERPAESHDVNVNGTLHVLEAARSGGCKVVYAASSSAYGNTPTLPKHEDMREDPLSPYAAGKLASELYLRAWARVYGLPTVVLRFFNVYGPRQRPDSPYSGVVAKFIWALMRRERPQIEGDGEQSRDFTYVDDTVEGVVRAMRRDVPTGALCNVATGQRVTINQLARTLAEIMDVRVEPSYGAARAGDVRHSLADIGRARELLGYAPGTSLRDGLKKTVDWYLAKEKS